MVNIYRSMILRVHAVFFNFSLVQYRICTTKIPGMKRYDEIQDQLFTKDAKWEYKFAS